MRDCNDSSSSGGLSRNYKRAARKHQVPGLFTGTRRRDSCNRRNNVRAHRRRIADRSCDGGQEMTHYQVLQISESASPEVIKASYKALMRIYHPDNGTAPNAEMSRLVIEAYHILIDP